MKKIVDFKDFFTNLLLTSWHLACTWETWSSSLCYANSLPSILYLNITKRWKVSEKLKGPSVPDLVPSKLSFPCSSHNFYHAMFRHVGVNQFYPALLPNEETRTFRKHQRTKTREIADTARKHVRFFRTFEVGRISIMFIRSF